MFSVGDRVKIISGLVPYNGHYGEIDLVQRVYTRVYLKYVYLYRVILDNGVSYSFREGEFDYDKQWIRECKLKDLGL